MISKPQVSHSRLGYRLTWSEGIVAEVTRLQEGEHLSAEVIFYQQAAEQRGLLHMARVSLTSSQSKAALVRALNERMPSLDWSGAVEQLALIVTYEHRHAGETVRLATVDTPARRWFLYPYLEEDEVTVVYAYGGSGKSIFALAAALSLATGQQIVGTPAQKEGVPVLYLDWETSAAVHKERLLALCTGQKLANANPPIFYRRMAAPIGQAVDSILGDIETTGAKAVIVDSLGMAGAGAPEEATTAIQTFSAIRALGVTALALHHRRKGLANSGGDIATIFGSAYYVNAARHVWEIDSQTGDNSIEMALIHMKANNSTLKPRHGFTFTFFNDLEDTCQAITVSYIANLAGSDLAEHATLVDRIIHELRHGKRSVQEIATAVEYDEHIVRSTLSRLARQNRIIRLDRSVYGLAAES